MHEYGYVVTIYAVGDDGRSQALLGTVVVRAPNARMARRLALEELWDARLDAVDCHPTYYVQREQ